MNTVAQLSIPCPTVSTESWVFVLDADHSIPVACGITALITIIGRGIPCPTSEASVGGTVSSAEPSIEVANTAKRHR